MCFFVGKRSWGAVLFHDDLMKDLLHSKGFISWFKISSFPHEKGGAFGDSKRFSFILTSHPMLKCQGKFHSDRIGLVGILPPKHTFQCNFANRCLPFLAQKFRFFFLGWSNFVGNHASRATRAPGGAVADFDLGGPAWKGGNPWWRRQISSPQWLGSTFFVKIRVGSFCQEFLPWFAGMLFANQKNGSIIFTIGSIIRYHN